MRSILNTAVKATAITLVAVVLLIANTEQLNAQAQARMQASAVVVNAAATTDLVAASHQTAADLYQNTHALALLSADTTVVRRDTGTAVVTARLAHPESFIETSTVPLSGRWGRNELTADPAEVQVLVEFAAN